MNLNPEWLGKLSSKKGPPQLEHIEIINKFIRNEIFNHNYNEFDIFKHLYLKNTEAKRQPNPFMIFRAILGLVAASKIIKIGDGTLQSKIAGYMWRGSSSKEKESFKQLTIKFKKLHKETFPSYEYRPKPRSPTAGTIVETRTQRDYENVQNVDQNPENIETTNIQQLNLPSQLNLNLDPIIFNYQLPIPYLFQQTPVQLSSDQDFFYSQPTHQQLPTQDTFATDLINGVAMQFPFDYNTFIPSQQTVQQNLNNDIFNNGYQAVEYINQDFQHIFKGYNLNIQNGQEEFTNIKNSYLPQGSQYQSTISTNLPN